MLGWFSGTNGNSQGDSTPSSEKFSLKTLHDLHLTLQKNQQCTNSNQEVLIETIRAVAEVIVYGDQHTEQLFDFFCEKNMFPLLLGLLDQPNCSSAVKVQIIQSVSILVQNIRSEISLYYTLSNNHVNRLIAHPFNFANEELLGHYISFLKTLSLKLNEQTIQFFFNDRLNTFPLFEEAVKLFDHPEGMVQTAVRTITLNVFRVQDAMMYSWLLEGPAAQYVEQVSRFFHKRIRRLHLLLLRARQARQIDPSLVQEMTPTMDHKGLKTLLLHLEVALTEQQDNFLYLEDMLMLNEPRLEDIVVDSSMAFLFLPLLLASLLPQTHPFSELDDLSEKDFAQIGLKKEASKYFEASTSGSLLSLFLLAHSFFWFTNPRLLNRLTEAMFLPPPDPEQSHCDTHTKQKLSLERCQPSEGEGGDGCESDSSDDTDGTCSILSSATPERSQRFEDDRSLRPKHILVERTSSASVRTGNPIYSAFMGFLRHPNERHCLGAVCVIYAMINNSNIDPSILAQAGLTPAGFRRVRREVPEEKDSESPTNSSRPPSPPEEDQPPLPPGAEGEMDSLKEKSEAGEVSNEGAVASSVSENGDNELLDEQKPNGESCDHISCEGHEHSFPTEEERKSDQNGDVSSPYPIALVESLLDILLRDPPVCTLTQRVVAKLIIDLTFIEENGNQKAVLSEAHIEKLDRAYVGAVTRLRCHMGLKFHKEEPARLLEMIEMEWSSLCEGPLRVESLMTQPHVFLPANLGPAFDEDKTVLPLDSRQPFSLLESSRCAIRSFMILRLLWTTINRKSNSHLANVASTTTTHRENKSIDLRECNYVKVFVLNGNGSTSPIQPMFLVLIDGTLILVEPDRYSLGKGIIRSVMPLHRVSFAQHHNDELEMHLVTRTPPGQAIGLAHKEMAPLVANSVALFTPGTAATPGSPNNDDVRAKLQNPDPSQCPWAWPTNSEQQMNRSDISSNLRRVVSWHITLRFDDHASAFLVRSKLEPAILDTVETRLSRFHQLLELKRQ